MDEKIFRAYSIRGVFGETLTAQDMVLIGQAAGTMLGKAGITHAVIGRDYRLSSAELSVALLKGLVSTGMHLTDIGACPTPLLNFATDRLRAGAGLMVTASHNPPQYNGLKIRTAHTWRAKELRCLYEITRRGPAQRGPAQGGQQDRARFYHTGRAEGTISHRDPLGDYLDAICRRADVRRPLRFVVDAGHGAAGPVVPRLLERLGCQAIPLHCVPDGRFPGRAPDPTASAALDELSARVLTEEADAGLAYDGDGDRLAMVDDLGQPVYADRLLTLLARDVLASHPGATIVYELSCTQALPETVEALGGKAVPCPVGYAFVHETMRATKAILGGEAAGHLFFDDPDFRFDDAMLATAKMISLLSQSDARLSSMLSQLPQYVRSPQYRFHCPDGLKSEAVQLVHDHFAQQGFTVDRLDGAKVHLNQGWALFRASNTQPAVTLHYEASTAIHLDAIRETMLHTIQDALAGLGIEMSNAH